MQFYSQYFRKKCVKFLWNLLNSDNVLFSRICKYFVYNSDTTMGENMRYFMYKYNLMYDDWFSDLNDVYIKIEALVHNITKLDDVCVAGAVRELCEARDSRLPQFVDSNQLSTMIDLMCTKEIAYV